MLFTNTNSNIFYIKKMQRATRLVWVMKTKTLEKLSLHQSIDTLLLCRGQHGDCVSWKPNNIESSKVFLVV